MGWQATGRPSAPCRRTAEPGARCERPFWSGTCTDARSRAAVFSAAGEAKPTSTTWTVTPTTTPRRTCGRCASAAIAGRRPARTAALGTPSTWLWGATPTVGRSSRPTAQARSYPQKAERQGEGGSKLWADRPAIRAPPFLRASTVGKTTPDRGRKWQIQGHQPQKRQFQAQRLRTRNGTKTARRLRRPRPSGLPTRG